MPDGSVSGREYPRVPRSTRSESRTPRCFGPFCSKSDVQNFITARWISIVIHLRLIHRPPTVWFYVCIKFDQTSRYRNVERTQKLPRFRPLDQGLANFDGSLARSRRLCTCFEKNSGRSDVSDLRRHDCRCYVLLRGGSYDECVRSRSGVVSHFLFRPGQSKYTTIINPYYSWVRSRWS